MGLAKDGSGDFGSRQTAQSAGPLAGLLVADFSHVLSGPFAYAAEISTNGLGGGPWNDPTTWSGKIVPGPADDVVIRKFDIVVFNRDDSTKASCRKLQIDPRGGLTFKTGAAETMECVAGGCEYRLAGSALWQPSGPGHQFSIPANSSFDIRVAQAYHYICHFG